MGSRSSFDVDNPRALTDLFKEFEDPERMESALRKGAAEAATIFKREIVLRAPVRHGYLRNSVSVAHVPEESVKGKVATYETVFVGTAPNQPNGKPGMRNSDVARWDEFGTSKQAAEPFVRPSFDAKKEEAAEACAEKILEVLTDGGQNS